MPVCCIVQARMGSRRLPGKVLAPLGPGVALELQLRRLAGVPVDHLVVATTDTTADDEVERVARRAGVEVVRGPEHDVLRRFRMVVDRFEPTEIVRLTADCPLLDARVVRACIAHRAATGADYVSNTVIRTYPDGLDVEVLTAAALREADDRATDPFEREHVTPYVYRRPEAFRLGAVVGDRALGHLRWTLDTADDLEVLRRLVAGVADPVSARWEDFLALDPTAGATGTGPGWRPALAGEEALVGGPVDQVGLRRLVFDDDGQVLAVADLRITGGSGMATVEPRGAGADDLEATLRAALAADAQLRELHVVVGAP